MTMKGCSSCSHLSGEEGHRWAIDPGIIPSSSHAFQIVLSFLWKDTSAGELTVIHYDLISFHCLLHGNQGICTNTKMLLDVCRGRFSKLTARWLNKTLRPTSGNLVAKPSAPTVDHHTHLAFMVNTHLLGGIVIEDLVHHLNFSVMISCS